MNRLTIQESALYLSPLRRVHKELEPMVRGLPKHKRASVLAAYSTVIRNALNVHRFEQLTPSEVEKAVSLAREMVALFKHYSKEVKPK